MLTPQVKDTCRFAEVCAGCPGGCTPSEIVVERNDSVPFCAEVHPGVVAERDGVTLNSLQLKPGFFRISNESHDVLECYQEEACQGGEDPENYCTRGYKGPCEMGFSRSRVDVPCASIILATSVS